MIDSGVGDNLDGTAENGGIIYTCFSLEKSSNYEDLHLTQE